MWPPSETRYGCFALCVYGWCYFLLIDGVEWLLTRTTANCNKMARRIVSYAVCLRVDWQKIDDFNTFISVLFNAMSMRLFTMVYWVSTLSSKLIVGWYKSLTCLNWRNANFTRKLWNNAISIIWMVILRQPYSFFGDKITKIFWYLARFQRRLIIQLKKHFLKIESLTHFFF